MPAIPCPSCGGALPPQPVQCPHCHLSLVGPVAARLWQVDQALGALQVERAHLLTGLRALGPTTATPVLPVATVLPATAGRRTWTTQQTLLAVGVLLVLVASSLALAIAWFVIGPYGQVLVMGGFTALAAGLALHLSRRRLPSSAEALALVSGGLMLLDATAARRMDLLALQGVDGRGYAVVTGLLLAVLLAWLHQRDRRVAGFAVLSLTAASAAWGGVLSFVGDGPAATSTAAFLALVGSAGFGLLRRGLPEALGLVRRAAGGPAAGWAMVALVIGSVGALDAYDPRSGASLQVDGLLSVAVLVLLAVGSVLVVRHVVTLRARLSGSRAGVHADWQARPFTGDWRAMGVLAVTASTALPVAVFALGLQLAALGAAVLACLIGVAAIAVVSLRPWGTGVGELWAEAQSGVVLVTLVGAALVHDSDPGLVTTLTVMTLLAATIAVQRISWRAGASAVAAVTASGAVAVAAGLVSPVTQCVTLSLWGAALVAGALSRRGLAEEVPVGVVGALVGFAALLAASATAPTWAVVTALAAVTAEATAVAVLRPRLRAPAACVAAASGTWALWLLGEMASAPVQLAVVALAAAALAGLGLWRRPFPEEAVLSAFASVVAVLVVADALVQGWPHVASGLAAAYGLVGVGYAALPRRRAVVAFAIGALTAAAWIEAAEARVDTLEVYSLPLAVLLLAAGLWCRRELGGHSWLTVGPGAAVGLLPSALATVDDDPVLRVAFAVVVAGVALALGAWHRWQALVVVGAVAAVVVGLTQLGPVAMHLPKSVTLGLVGSCLLAIGARYEQRRASARRAASWLASMT